MIKLKEFRNSYNRVPDIIDFCGDPVDLYFLTCEREEDAYKFEKNIECRGIRNKIFNTIDIVRFFSTHTLIGESRKMMSMRLRKYMNARSLKERSVRYM